MTDYLGLLRAAADDYRHGGYQSEPGCLSVAIDDVEWAVAEIERLQTQVNVAHSSDIAYLIGMAKGAGMEIPPFITHNHNRWKAQLEATSGE